MMWYWNQKMFETYLELFLKRQLHALGQKSEEPARPLAPVIPLRPDLKALHTAYNQQGQLSLADVKPAGLLLRSKG